MSKTISQPYSLPDPLPHPALPLADWGDRFGIVLDPALLTAPITARQVFERMTANTPGWISRLMDLRNRLAQRVGLKTAAMTAFPILSETPDEVVAGFNDSHLDFRLIIRLDPAPQDRIRASIATLVLRHNRMGRAYLAVVAPFHRLIVRRLLQRLAS